MLLFLQVKSNNVKQFFIKFVSNELAYDFKINDIINMLTNLLSKNYNRLRLIKCEEVEFAMIFANALIKSRYDSVYQALRISINNKMYLKLHQKYIIFDFANHKLSH